MPAPIPADRRTAIIADIRSGKGRNQIAREHGVSSGTVTRIAKHANLDQAFDRAELKKATRASAADMASRRAQIADDLLADINRLRERAWSPYDIITNGPDGPEITKLELPPLRDVQAAYTSIGIALDKHLAVTRHDADPGTDTARSLLGDLGRALGAAAEALTDPEQS